MGSECCSTRPTTTMLLPCSGASNVGQLANAAAIALTREGTGRMFCLAGIGGGIQGFVQSARDAASIVAIDGCEVGCAKACLEKAGVPVFGHLCLTDLDIKKNKNFDLPAEEVARVTEAVRRAVAAQEKAAAGPTVV